MTEARRMSKVGRTVWWAKDSAWWRREGIVELGEEFGPAGPAVIDWLSCEAKVQNDGGRLRTGYRSLSRGCFVDHETACHVVSRSVTLGLLDDFEEAERRFTCRISGWQADQTSGQAAARQAAARGRAHAANGAAEPNADSEQSVTKRDESRSVTHRHGESLNRTVEKRVKNTPPTPPQAGGPPSPPSGGRGRDRDRYVAELQAWAPHPAGGDIGRLTELWAETAADIRQAVTDTVWASYLRSLHVHRTYGDELVLGCDPKTISWVETNHRQLIEHAAGTPVRLVPCDKPHPDERRVAA